MPKIIFVEQGKEIEVEAPIGQSVMEVATHNGIGIEAACEGSLACATCHLICDAAWFDKLSAKSEEEEDMLDFAFNLTDTSRLSCQIRMSEELDGIKFFVPED